MEIIVAALIALGLAVGLIGAVDMVYQLWIKKK